MLHAKRKIANCIIVSADWKAVKALVKNGFVYEESKDMFCVTETTID